MTSPTTSNVRTELYAVLDDTQPGITAAQSQLKAAHDAVKVRREAARKAVREALRDAVLAELDEHYTLCYADRGDRLSDKQIEALANGDTDSLWEDNWEWEADQRYDSAKDIIEQETNSVLITWASEDDMESYDDSLLSDIDWDRSDEWDAVRYEIEERDDSEVYKDLAGNSGQVMLRITIRDEDAAYGYETVTPEQFLLDLGLPLSAKNVATADTVIAEAGPEHGYLMVSLLASVDVLDLYNMPWNTETVRITNPGIWLGNYGSGNGYAEQFEGSITVARADIRTDKGGFGYGWQEVAGCHAGAFPVEFEPIAVEIIEEQP